MLPNKTNDRKHAFAVAKKILDEIPSKLQRQIKKLEILLVNEKIDDKGTIRVPGILEIRGHVVNIQMKSKIMAIIRKHADNRRVKDMVAV
jgi:hypothetical protein